MLVTDKPTPVIVDNVQSGGKRWKTTGVLVINKHTQGRIDNVQSGGKRWKTTEASGV